jgi:predicted DNA binding CopG/RHH family protein
MTSEAPIDQPLFGDSSMHYEYEKKLERINMRLPTSLLMAIKTQAQSRGIPYQRLIREAVEMALASDDAKQAHF